MDTQDPILKENVSISDVCGIWEVVHTSDNDENEEPILMSRRNKYLFLEQMVFIRYSEGQPSYGTWELSKKDSASEKRYSIILNGTFECVIIDINKDEMTLFNRINKYYLERRL